MPFTISHTIAVYPFVRWTPKYLSISGLVMGSMAPDFEFFLRLELYGIIGHTFWGIFWFDLPVSIVILLLFHQVVREPLILHLPNFLLERFGGFVNIKWLEYFKKHYFRVVFSILLGIFTHFLWDNFTHEPDYVSPVYFDFLLQKCEVFGVKKYFFSILQIISSFTGLAGFLIVVFRLKRRSTLYICSYLLKVYYWAAVGIMAVTIVGLRYWWGVPNEKPNEQLLVVLIGGSLISLTLVSWIWQMRNASNGNKKSSI
ncbi:MAG: DUF4184 family protein [Spirosomataceae bacterium]|jgi:hypothetical protein